MKVKGSSWKHFVLSEMNGTSVVILKTQTIWQNQVLWAFLRHQAIMRVVLLTACICPINYLCVIFFYFRCCWQLVWSTEIKLNDVMYEFSHTNQSPGNPNECLGITLLIPFQGTLLPSMKLRVYVIRTCSAQCVITVTLLNILNSHIGTYNIIFPHQSTHEQTTKMEKN